MNIRGVQGMIGTTALLNDLLIAYLIGPYYL